MSIDSIPDRRPRQTMLAAWLNLLRTILSGDFVPRATGGGVSADAGSLGTSSIPYLKHHIAVGGMGPGDFKVLYDYNATAPVGHGWMLCDGRQVTEAAYNTEHGAGTWATYIGTSPILNKYLPNMNEKFFKGSATTTQDGSLALTFTGNASNQINVAHTHGANTTSTVAKDGVNSQGVNAGSTGWPPIKTNIADHSHSLTPASSLSATQSVKPHSLNVKIYMRII